MNNYAHLAPPFFDIQDLKNRKHPHPMCLACLEYQKDLLTPQEYLAARHEISEGCQDETILDEARRAISKPVRLTINLLLLAFTLSFGYNGTNALTFSFNRFAPPDIYLGRTPIQEAIKNPFGEYTSVSR